jgi:hypothetical protein
MRLKEKLYFVLLMTMSVGLIVWGAMDKKAGTGYIPNDLILVISGLVLVILLVSSLFIKGE